MRFSSLFDVPFGLMLRASISTTAAQERMTLISDAGSLAAHDHRDSAVVLGQRAYDNAEVLLGANIDSFGANCPESETPCR